MISDKYATILTVLEYPKAIGPGWLSNVTSIPGVKLCVKHIPIELSTMQKTINKEIAELKEAYQRENDHTLKERIRLDYESMENFVSMLAATQSKIFDFQMHIMIMADTKDELDSKKMQIKNFLTSLGMRAIPMMFEQEKVLKSMIPIFPKQDVESRIGIPVPAPTVAAMYPFVFDSIKDPGKSTLFGIDFSGGVVLFNQFLYQIRKEFNRNNANMIILGTSGSGKSTCIVLPECIMFAKAKNKRSIIVTDPKGEIFSKTSKLFKDNGYNIYTIDFRNPNLSNRINIMQPIINEWKLHCSSNNKLFICMCYLYEKLKIDYDLFVSNESYRNEIKLKNKIDNYIIEYLLNKIDTIDNNFFISILLKI